MANKKDKLKALYAQLKELESKGSVPTAEITELTDSLIAEEVALVASQLKDNPKIKILQRFSQELKNFRTELDLKPILTAVQALSNEIEQNGKTLTADFEQKIKSSVSTFDPSELVQTITDAKSSLLKDFNSQNEVNAKSFESLFLELGNIKASVDGLIKSGDVLSKTRATELEDLNTKLGKLSRLGGGAMDRQMFIGGVDPLKRYTDMNIKAGSNVTISYVNNNTTKKVDVTFSATGGSGSGIVRSINSIAVDTAAGQDTTTDYVYLCSGTLTLTLPDATTNSNLYTIKNVGAGIVTVATTSSQTIDGSLTITLPTQYTSVDVSSDTANWNVT